MLRESAVVNSYENAHCQSEMPIPESACGQYATKNSCGTSSLSELNGKRGETYF